MLKIHPEYGIYALSLKKAVKGLIKTGFISEELRLKVIIDGWNDNLLADLLADGLEYRKVNELDFELFDPYYVRYTVEGEDTPMTYEEIYAKYNLLENCFVAICRTENNSLSLTGFVFKIKNNSI